MRTRTSPRNQARLWRALTPPAHTPESIQGPKRCWGCISYPTGGRARGECVLAGQVVLGRSADRDCFRQRITERPGGYDVLRQLGRL